LKAPDGATPPLLAFYLHYRGWSPRWGESIKKLQVRTAEIRVNRRGLLPNVPSTLEILVETSIIGEQK